MRSFVIAKHEEGPGGTYLFEVPEGQIVAAGEKIIVQTRHGERIATAVSGAFTAVGEALETVKRMLGATTIMPVVGRMVAVRWLDGLPNVQAAADDDREEAPWG